MTSVASLRVRPLRASDAGALAELFADLRADTESVHFHPHPFTSEEAARIAQRKGIRRDVYFAATVDGKLAGYGMLRGWDEGYVIPSFGVAVGTRHRGSGIGRSLLRYAISRARQRGAEKMILKVHPENVHAKRLYASEGFTFDDVPVAGGQLKGTLLL